MKCKTCTVAILSFQWLQLLLLQAIQTGSVQVLLVEIVAYHKEGDLATLFYTVVSGSKQGETFGSTFKCWVVISREVGDCPVVFLPTSLVSGSDLCD